MIHRLALCVLAAFPVGANADGLDATQPLRCALAEAAECDEAAFCTDVTLDQIALPEAWRIDFAAKQLTSLDGKRSSPIGAVEALERVVVLQGQEAGRGFTIVVERATGRLSATLTDIEGVFVLAGGCSAE